MKLRLPLSHGLPVFRSVFPQYGENLYRTAAALRQKYPEATAIDVGANVGDSVAFIRDAADWPILCIEGEPRFNALLQTNTAHLSDVEIVQAFVGPGQGETYSCLVEGTGTSRLVAGDGEGPASLVPLAQIAAQHPRFESPRLVKIDTDGFDLQIISGDIEFLQAARAAVFFEYDPFLFADQGVGGLEVFRILRDAGYSLAAFWDNWGDYLLTAGLDDVDLLTDLAAYYEGRGGGRYADVCVFHEQDRDVAQILRQGERAFFGKFRPRPAAPST
ncbi:MAG: FkbM family methyltransferase [Planctomycetota bacterium]